MQFCAYFPAAVYTQGGASSDELKDARDVELRLQGELAMVGENASVNDKT